MAVDGLEGAALGLPEVKFLKAWRMEEVEDLDFGVRGG